jgi:hypothetical protein
MMYLVARRQSIGTMALAAELRQLDAESEFVLYTCTVGIMAGETLDRIVESFTVGTDSAGSQKSVRRMTRFAFLCSRGITPGCEIAVVHPAQGKIIEIGIARAAVTSVADISRRFARCGGRSGMPVGLVMTCLALNIYKPEAVASSCCDIIEPVVGC